jgi:hypothetical protein
VITQAIMGSITWWRYAETVDAGGVCAEIEARAKEMGGSLNLLEATDDPSLRALLKLQAEKAGLVRPDGSPTYEILRSETFKIVADALVRDAGITPVLHCWVVGALVEDGAVVGVITESKSGRQVIRARRVIDCTGDADVAAFCGAPFHVAPLAERMEMSTNFSLCNVDLPKFALFVAGQDRTMADWVDEACAGERDMFSTHVFRVFEDAKAAGELPADLTVDLRAFPGGFSPEGQVLSLNAVHQWQVDGLDVLALTRAEMEGRRGVAAALEVFKKRVPGFEKAALSMIGPSIGVRETRQILGGYRLTEADVRGQARFDDSIGIFPEFLDAYKILCLPTTGRYFQVPYRVTVPQGVENLLVAGRPVSGDKVSHAATRQMGCCMVTGQGAGVAAAVSLRDGNSVRDVDLGAVQAELTAQGVRLG